jgi:3-keto-disaccharide hydrolase
MGLSLTSRRAGVLTTFAVLAASALVTAQSNGSWKPLFNGKDFTGWMVAGRGGAPPQNPEDAGWKIENGVIVGGQGAPGQRGGSLVSQERFKDLELEFDFMLAEQPSAADGSCATCTYNSGVSLRTGYQVNLGRREAGEFIGVVVHRVHPKAIRGNVLWLDTGDERFPNLRKKEDWNHAQISFKGPRLQVTLNGTKVCDVTDDPTDPAEASWKDAGPISLQWPPAGEAAGFNGFIKFGNMRVRPTS